MHRAGPLNSSQSHWHLRLQGHAALRACSRAGLPHLRIHRANVSRAVRRLYLGGMRCRPRREISLRGRLELGGTTGRAKVVCLPLMRDDSSRFGRVNVHTANRITFQFRGRLYCDAAKLHHRLHSAGLVTHREVSIGICLKLDGASFAAEVIELAIPLDRSGGGRGVNRHPAYRVFVGGAGGG
jgi:hypothetical protein